MSKIAKIKKENIIYDVIMDFPKAAEIMLIYGLHCVGCSANQFETIEVGAKVHGMSDEEIKKMVREINAELKKVV